jgi:16S rRNA (guanine527-N7)-methyltransferase
LGVQGADAQAESVGNYLILLMKWNTRINLTSARNEREALSSHLLDCLAVVPHVPEGTERLVDAGSGAGLPAVVIALFRPEVEVTALEPVHKKHAFLSAVKRELPVTNLHAFSQRIEDHLLADTFRPYDVAVSRATWTLPTWLERGPQLIRRGGLVLGMEGSKAHPLPDRATRHPYGLDDRTRAIIEYRPAKP